MNNQTLETIATQLFPQGSKFEHDLINTPTRKEFEQAFEKTFGAPLEECEVEYVNFGQNRSLQVVVPGGKKHIHAFPNYTRNPVLKPGQRNRYDGCGPNWDTDANGERFYLKGADTERFGTRRAYETIGAYLLSLSQTNVNS